MARKKKLLVFETICLFVALLSIISVFIITMASYTKKTGDSSQTSGSFASVMVDVGNALVNDGYYVYSLNKNKTMNMQIEVYNSGDVDVFTKVGVDVGVKFGETDLTQTFKYNNYLSINNFTYSQDVIENTNGVLSLTRRQIKNNGAKVNFEVRVNSNMPQTLTIDGTTYNFTSGSNDIDLYVKYNVAAVQQPNNNLSGAELDTLLSNMIPDTETITYTMEGAAGAGAKVFANGTELIGVTHAWDVSENADGKAILYLSSGDNGTSCSANLVGSGATVDKGSSDSYIRSLNLGNKINSVFIQKGITHIGKYMFYTASNFTDVFIPNTVTTLNNGVFCGCTKLQNVVFEHGSQLTDIWHEVFASCNITSFTLPKSVTHIESSMLYNNKNLTEIKVEEGNTNYKIVNGCLLSMDGWSLVDACNYASVPDGVGSIGRSAFQDRKFNNITLPSTVKTINLYGFRGVNITDIVIPSKVSYIASSSFYNSSMTIFMEHTSSSVTSGFNSSWLTGHNGKVYWYSETANYDGAHWRYVDGVPVAWQNIALTGSGAGASITINGTAVSNVTHAWDVSATGTNQAILYLTSSNSGVSYEAHLIGTGDTISYTYTNTPLAASGVKTKITSLSIQKGITSIGQYLFYALDKINSIFVPNSVRVIDVAAFYNCPNVTSAVIEPNGNLERIAGESFGYTKFTTFTIPKTVTTIGAGAFIGNNKLAEIIVEEGNTNYYVESGCLIKENDKYLVDSTNSAQIPQDVTAILGASMRGKDLVINKIPNSVNSLAAYAFGGIKNTEIVIPSSVKTIQSRLFYQATNLTKIFMEHTSESEITSLNADWLYSCNATVYWYSETEKEGCWHYVGGVPKLWESLVVTGSGAGASVTINGTAVPNVTHAWDVSATGTNQAILYLTSTDSGASYSANIIGGGATKNFSWSSAYLKTSGVATKITSVNIEKGITKIGEYTFYAVNNFTDIVIPNSVVELASGAFCACEKLINVTFESGSRLTKLGNEVFSSCDIRTITFPKTLTTIIKPALTNNKNLAEIIVEEGNANFKVVNGCLISMDGKTLYDVTNHAKLPYGITKIFEATFRGKKFDNLFIPSSVVGIDPYVFRATNIESIIIPSSVTYIGGYIFQDNTNITAIYMEHTSSSVASEFTSTWASNCNATIYWYSETQKAGCWHYENGVPTLW